MVHSHRKVFRRRSKIHSAEFEETGFPHRKSILVRDQNFLWRMGVLSPYEEVGLRPLNLFLVPLTFA